MARKDIFGFLAVAAPLTLPNAAQAWEEETHYKIVDNAYWTMQALRAEGSGHVFPVSGSLLLLGSFDAQRPDDVASADWTSAKWNAFVQALITSSRTISTVPTGLPPPRGRQDSSCTAGFTGGDTLHDLPGAPIVEYIGNKLDSDKCAFRRHCSIPGSGAHCYSPDGIFASIPDCTNCLDNSSPPEHFDFYAGAGLGVWAASADYRWKDSQLEWLPIFGPSLQLFEAAAVLGGTAVVAPLCLIALIGGDDDCFGITEWLEEKNPIRYLRGSIGGLPWNVGEGDFVGIWHFLDARPGGEHRYDDRQGWHMTDGGWQGFFDASELGMLAYLDGLSVSLDYAGSRGPKAYSYDLPMDYTEPDWDRYTGDRKKWQWQAYLTKVPMAPIDNLALDDYLHWYGATQGTTGYIRNVNQFGDPWMPQACFLTGPLHAIGDVTVPHHVVNTSGWGHVPFEETGKHSWQDILQMNEPDAQYEFARGALKRAFAWRKFIRDYKTANNTPAIPIRKLLTAIADRTYDHLINMPSVQNAVCQLDLLDNHQPAPWPLISCVSHYDKLGVGIGGNFVPSETPYLQNIPGYRFYVQEAIGAAIALLSEATVDLPSNADELPIACIADDPQ